MSARDESLLPDSACGPSRGICDTSPPLPPWLWFWLVRFLIFVVPSQISQLRENVVSLWRIQISFSERMAQILSDCRNALGADPVCDHSMLNSDAVTVARMIFSGILDFVPYAILMVGVVFVLLPFVTTAIVERIERPRYLPTDYPSQAIADLRAELAECPSIVLRDCLARTNLIAFVYPIGFSRTGLALGGKLVVTWRRNPNLARAIVAHELTHWRQGEGILLHAGSPMLMSLRYLPAIFLVIGVLPMLFESGLLILDGLHSLEPTVGALKFTLLEGWDLLRITVPAALLRGIAFASGFVVPFVPMITAVWSAELCADLVAVRVAPATYPDFLRQMKLGGGIWLRIQNYLTHPPRAIRIWCVTRSQSNFVVVVLLLVCPLGYLLANVPSYVEWTLVVFQDEIIDPYFKSENGPGPFVLWTLKIIWLIMQNAWGILLECAGWVAVWPAANRALSWLRGIKYDTSISYGPYAIATAILLCAAALSYLAR